MVSLMKIVQLATLEYTCLPSQIPVSSLAAKVASQSLTKVQTSQVCDVGKWVLQLGVHDYPNEFFTWHSVNIDSTEITLTSQWLDKQCDALPKSVPIFRLNSTEIHLADKTEAEKKIRPNPDVARLISIPDMVAIGKRVDYIKMIEKFMFDTRKEVKPALMKILGSEVAALDLIRELEHQVTRIAYCKAPLQTFTGIAGTLDEDNLRKIKSNWFEFVVAKNESLFQSLREDFHTYFDALQDIEKVPQVIMGPSEKTRMA